MFEKAIANAPSIIMVGVIAFVLYTLFNMIESSQRRTSTTTKKKCLFCNEDAIYLITSPSRQKVGLKISGILGNQPNWIKYIRNI